MLAAPIGSTVWQNLNTEPGLYFFRFGGAVLLVLAALIIGHIVSSRVRGALKRTTIGPNPEILLARLARFGVYLVAFLWILEIFGVPFTALAAIVSIATLAVSLSFQDLLRNFIAGIYLLAERPFHIGDQITVSGVTGVIDDIQMRATLLHSAAGEQVVMPNQTVFTQVVVNHTAAGTQLRTLDVEFPRDTDVDEIPKRTMTVVGGVSNVAGKPAPQLEPVGLTAETSVWKLSVWLKPGGSQAEVVLALGRAIPEILIKPPA